MRRSIRGSLYRHVPSSPTTAEELLEMRRVAWHKQGIIVLKVTDVRDEIIRQAIINEANRLFGHRQEGG